MKRFWERPGQLFLLIFAWKAVLLFACALPPPANDAYFYDGPVVHFLNHGGYFNPAIAQSRPISGTVFFSSYPPLYQITLLGWMTLAGTSVVSAMAFHLALFGAYQLTVLALFRRWQIAGRNACIAGLFLFAITFDDRPDALACLFGTLGIYASVRSFAGFRHWSWLAAVFGLLAMATSLQMGALYAAWIFLSLVAGWKFLRTRLPAMALAAMILLPPVLLALVRFGFPNLWAGFLENVHGNASLTGVRMPQFGDLLKAGRGLAAVFLLTPIVILAARKYGRGMQWTAREVVFVTGLPTALAFMAACFTIVAANWMGIINYFQPILIALFLTAVAERHPQWLRTRTFAGIVAALVGVASIRVIGLSTWGLTCAADVSETAAIRRVGAELDAVPPQANVLLSAAYLYEADRHPGGNWIHEDYAPTNEAKETFPQALRRLRPAKLVLTQFDYFRRYRAVLEQLRATGGEEFTVTNLAQVRAPESFLAWQQVVQHISWAPVIVTFQWPNTNR